MGEIVIEDVLFQLFLALFILILFAVLIWLLYKVVHYVNHQRSQEVRIAKIEKRMSELTESSPPKQK
ncbi:hypothetical protein N781_04820 [Pontibacillus halophilus JSM 076056 = DSM 19796]|uniref:DUF4083 domain-containing protein n=1 Tax=Pontibacillus halophilus JSM 076056 = DSM 19796 TaxID=1385510 RepID=A0A0A5GJS5_9BACI|nr:hypothetical protein [Pontibacillus halophilus]KGX91415.1 hypothetical protein N781_04820 [Pontibacillus halophilus JSM 076056 = DSM 19796]